LGKSRPFLATIMVSPGRTLYLTGGGVPSALAARVMSQAQAVQA
jgi:hypothetical protein